MPQNVIDELIEFLDRSPTCYHAVENLAKVLDSQGYTRLRENEVWSIAPGGKYYTVRGESAAIAFRIPAGKPAGFMLTASHSDSPTFKIRQIAEVPSAGGTMRLSVEGYGSINMRTWMDKPLSVAGRVFVRDGARIVSKHVCVDRDLLVIPSLAIHMNREMNKGVELKPNVDMLPVLSGKAERGAFRKLIAEAVGVAESDILSTELFLYPRTPGTRLGLNGEFIASPRLDDLECVFCCAKGFLAAEESESIPMLCVFNNEEVGSGTRQGANSTILEDVVRRISKGIGLTSEEYYACVSNSFMISADNAHAIHPAHSECADANEYPVINGGIVIKYNAAQKYTTDGLTGAVFASVCENAGAPVQRYSNRPDIAGGSTLGNISGTHFSIPTVDIGLPQYAMHSCYEVAGVEDVDSLIKAATLFYSRTFRRGEDGVVSLS